MATQSLYQHFLNEKSSNSTTGGPLCEAAREDLLRSFFSLCKTNNGRYKSEKQGAFLMSQTENGVFSIKQTINFGTSTHSQRFVEWDVKLDDVGVVSIYKRTGSKGEELYFARDDQPNSSESISSKAQANRDKNMVAHKVDLQNAIDLWIVERDKLQADIAKMEPALNDPNYERFKPTLIAKIDEYKADIEEYNRRIAYNEKIINQQ